MTDMHIVPWELYRSSRPRRPHSSAPVSSEAAGRLAKLARTELRVHEFTYLMLSVASPLLGASFLRYILSTLNGSDPLSWFSTTLVSDILDKMRSKRLTRRSSSSPLVCDRGPISSADCASARMTLTMPFIIPAQSRSSSRTTSCRLY